MAELTPLEELNNDMTGLADSIRAKSGIAGMLGIKAMKAAVDGIGSSAQRTTGGFTTDKSTGKATINCGFQPDLIYVYLLDYNGIEEGLSIPFGEQKDPAKPYCALGYWANGIYEITTSRTSTGFSVEVYDLGWGSAHNLVKNKSFNYVAVKYT